jgi:hypothetical protein
MPDQLATPLMKRPYDLRHAGIVWRLNSGVPAPQVAKWAGHSVEVLTRTYAGCVVGLDYVWIARMTGGAAPGGGCRIGRWGAAGVQNRADSGIWWRNLTPQGPQCSTASRLIRRILRW